ncbi:MAG: hypothetical protein IJ068_01150 [Bacilli bacterium]|nr:hypothetical protein [Bacilli bacterium]
MRKIKYMLGLCLFFTVLNVKAIDACTSEEMSRLKELANNVEIKYDYELFDDEYEDDNGNTVNTENKFAQYKFTVLNTNDDLRIAYSIGNESEKKTTKEAIENEIFNEGDHLRFAIYARTKNLCIDKILRTVDIKLSYYNNWYSENEEKCEEYKEFKYCKQFLEKNVDKDTIEKEFKKYSQDVNKEKRSKIWNNFVNNYLFKILIGIAVVGGGVAVFIIRRRKMLEGL